MVHQSMTKAHCFLTSAINSVWFLLLLSRRLGSSSAWATTSPPPTTAALSRQANRPWQERRTLSRRWMTETTTSITTSPLDGSGNQNDEDEDNFFQVFCDLGFGPHDWDDEQKKLQRTLEEQGLWGSGDSHVLQAICRDYYCVQQPNQLTRMLQDDFDLTALQAHMVRAVLWQMYSQQHEKDSATEQSSDSTNQLPASEQFPVAVATAQSTSSVALSSDKAVVGNAATTIDISKNVTRPLYKQVKVRTVATNRTEYGFSSSDNDSPALATLRQEMGQFWHEFMTRPNPYHPTAAPLRNATAEVYVRHANLFLGWYLQHHQHFEDDSNNQSAAPITLCTIFPNDSVESVTILLDFVRWLREDRQISASYEANVWRGLTKLVQFRHTQLQGQPAAVLDNLPALTQIRKWHREAHCASKNAPRRSQEDRKWLSWDDYLGVVQQCKHEFISLEEEYLNNQKTKEKEGDDSVTPQERRIATSLQRYLVLAIFATVPDRQRTIRELQIDRSLIKDPQTGMWCIKHAPKDYKTGKTYGERPKLLLHGLTEDIDLFLERWRPKLQPLTDFVFVQSRTRKPLTQDSVYQLVSRTCYQFTGQRTNPHLLRDSIVTHVRESTTTSEAELEALAIPLPCNGRRTIVAP